MSLLALDLDEFKAYNDRHGHPGGDDLLRRCVESWKRLLGDDELCVRLGGDEFVLLVRRPAADLPALAREALQAVPGPLTVSIGMASLEVGDSFDDLVARADRSLYLAKSARRPVVPRARTEPPLTGGAVRGGSSPIVRQIA